MASLRGLLRLGGGLSSRVATGLIFVVMARGMASEDFGSQAVSVSISLAFAAFLTTALGDAAVYGLASRSRCTARVWVAGVAFGTAGMICAVWIQPLGFFIVTAGHALVFSVDRVVRGPGPAIEWFLLGAPVGRLLAAVVAIEAMQDVLLALALVTYACLLCQALACMRMGALDSRTKNGGPSVGRATVVMLSSAAVFLLISQIDILVVRFFMGPDAVAAYLPTMKTLEALTAVGVYWQLQAPHLFLKSSRGMLEAVSLSVRATSTFVGAGLLVMVWGHELVPLVFGRSVDFLAGPAVALFIGYAALVALSPMLQWIAFQARMRLGMAVAASTLLGVPVVLIGGMADSLLVVAIGVGLCYVAGLGFLLLRVCRQAEDRRIRQRSA